jgi:hypothetical protein
MFYITRVMYKYMISLRNDVSDNTHVRIKYITKSFYSHLTLFNMSSERDQSWDICYFSHILTKKKGASERNFDFRSLPIIQSVMACSRLGCRRGTHISQDIIVFKKL